MKKKKHILIIDDDFIAIDALKHSFEKAGMRVTVIHEGSRALEVLKKGGVDLVLLDIRLPFSKIDGWGVLMEIKSDPDISNVPVFVLSNAGLQHEIVRGIELGAEAYWLKAHISIKDVISGVAEYLETGRVQVQQPP